MSKQKITVTMTRSKIATNPNQRENLIGLGLTSLGKQVVLDDTASNRGMIRKVIHLVDIQKGDQSKKAEKKTYFAIKEAPQKTSTKKTTKSK